jgi:nucleoside-diphosphate-sugar epimerase
MGQLHLITGATGMLGSHVAEALRLRGERVRALVRPASDASWLEARGVEVVRADLDDPSSLAAAVAGADVVYHCAARVGDWGPWRLFQKAVVETTGNLLVACQAAGVGRFLHVSSINVYGRFTPTPGQSITEDEPLGRSLWWWDHYCRAKIEAEALVRAYPLPWTIIRPSWIYGPRDRNTIPRVLKAVEAGTVRMVGDGSNKLNIVYASDIADGAVLAANSPAAVGRAYNLSSRGDVTQKELLDALTDLLRLPRITRRVPFRVAFAAGFCLELLGRTLGWKSPPGLTRYAVALIGRPTSYSIERAGRELGWSPKVHPLEGLRRVLAELGRA